MVSTAFRAVQMQNGCWKRTSKSNQNAVDSILHFYWNKSKYFKCISVVSMLRVFVTNKQIFTIVSMIIGLRVKIRISQSLFFFHLISKCNYTEIKTTVIFSIMKIKSMTLIPLSLS